MSRSFDEESIIKDIKPLQPDPSKYRPDELPERESELNQLHNVLRPVTMGGAPHNALVYGQTGQGKTVGIQIKTEELQMWADENDVDLTVVHMECKGCDNSYNVLTLLIKELREVRHGPGEDKPTGFVRKDLVEMAFEEMKQIGGTIVLILDEIDAIGEDDYVLYELSRAGLEDVHLGIIGVTNDLQFRGKLDSDVRSSLSEREVSFAPYNGQQLRNILARRAIAALKETRFEGNKQTYENLNSDVLTDKVIPLAAKFSAQENGDAREAIKLLQYACDKAEQRGKDMVEEDDVRAAREEIEKMAIKQGISTETPQRKVALLTVAVAYKNNDTPESTNNLYQRYQDYTEYLDLEQRSLNTFRDKLNDLAHSNILARNRYGRGRGKGMTNTYELKVDLDIVYESLAENDTYGFHDIIEQVNDQSTIKSWS